MLSRKPVGPLLSFAFFLAIASTSQVAHSSLLPGCNELNDPSLSAPITKSAPDRLLETKVDWRLSANVLRVKADTIAQKSIDWIFPSVETVVQIDQPAKRTEIRKEDIAVFDSLFDNFMDLSEHTYLPRYDHKTSMWSFKSNFRDWLKAHYARPYLPIERDTIDLIFKPGHYSFEKIVRYYFDIYTNDIKRAPSPFWVYTRLGSEHPTVVALRKAVKSKIVLGLLGIISARFTFDVGGALIDRGSSPVRQAVLQLGNTIGAPLASLEFATINFSEKELGKGGEYIMHVVDKIDGADVKKTDIERKNIEAQKQAELNRTEAVKEIRQTSEEIKSTLLKTLTQAQMQEMLFAWNQRYLQAVLLFGKGLPQDFGTGRNQLYDWQWGVAKDHAGAYSIHEDLYINAQSQYLAIKERITVEKRQPTPQEQRRLERLTTDMNFATHAIAQNFLAYQAHMAQYFEVARPSAGPENAEKAVREAFVRAASVIGFDEIIPAYGDEMQKMMAVMDPTLPNSQQFAAPGKKP